MKGPARRPIEERFWERVERTNTCWLWTGKAKHQHGYGVLGRGGHQAGMVGAHRVSWEIHYGAIPKGMVVCHRCDVPACVRPDHLFLGTQADNMADAWEKGRRGTPSTKGERNGRAKLTWNEVRQIRTRWNAGNTQTELARIYGVPQTQISRIVRNLSWREVSAIREV